MSYDPDRTRDSGSGVDIDMQPNGTVAGHGQLRDRIMRCQMTHSMMRESLMIQRMSHASHDMCQHSQCRGAGDGSDVKLEVKCKVGVRIFVTRTGTLVTTPRLGPETDYGPKSRTRPKRATNVPRSAKSTSPKSLSVTRSLTKA